MKTSPVPQTQSKGFAFEKEEGGNRAEFSPSVAETERRELPSGPPPKRQTLMGKGKRKERI